MWHWDQGRLEYFQFDNLRKISQFLIKYNFKNVSRELLRNETGLSFAAPDTHTPWRNYSRILKLMLLVYEGSDTSAIPTPVAKILARPGQVTCDEYLHFIASSSTEPSPALSGWAREIPQRYPLLFVLKYALARFIITSIDNVAIDEILVAYDESRFNGSEGQAEFINLINNFSHIYVNIPSTNNKSDLYRQSRESIFVLAQISYLHIQNKRLIVSLSTEDAIQIFNELEPLSMDQANDKNEEILRRAEMFKDGSTYNEFIYSDTVINNEIESGFLEGGRVKKTHICIERNRALRKNFLSINSSPICDVCRINTHKYYPWADRIIDLHHLLPLSSGTRVEGHGTTISDLVPLCPTCHRATHRFYDIWLKDRNRNDFLDRQEAREVYNQMKNSFNRTA